MYWCGIGRSKRSLYWCNACESMRQQQQTPEEGCTGTLLDSVPIDAGNYSVKVILVGTSNYKTSNTINAKKKPTNFITFQSLQYLIDLLYDIYHTNNFFDSHKPIILPDWIKTKILI